MVKIHFVGGENLVVELVDPEAFRARLEDSGGTVEVTHDGKVVVLRVEAIAAVVFLN